MTVNADRRAGYRGLGWYCPKCKTTYSYRSDDGTCGDLSHSRRQCDGELLELGRKTFLERQVIEGWHRRWHTALPHQETGGPMPAIVKLHKDGDNMAMSTNAQSEQEFLTALLPELAARLEHHADDLEFQLERWIPQIVDLCCKLRGYKADVREHRVLVAGEWLPADIVEAFTPRAIATAGA